MLRGKFDTFEEKEEFLRNASGLLGGQDIARDRIKSGASDDAIVGNSILKKRGFKRYSQNDEGYEHPYSRVKQVEKYSRDKFHSDKLCNNESPVNESLDNESPLKESRVDELCKLDEEHKIM